MKALIVVCDGMADRPVRELGYSTPLEAADTPGMDYLADVGVCGILDPVSPGTPPGSDVANLSLLGYDALKVYRGRGVFEALGAGLEVRPGDVAVRCNFATVRDGVIVDRRAGRLDCRPFEEALKEASRRIGPDVEAVFKHTTEHRAVLLLRGHGLSRMVSDSDPHMTGAPILKVKPLEGTPEAERTADILNRLSEIYMETLKEHPENERRRKLGLPTADAVIFRGAGQLPDIKSLRELYGVRSAVVAGNALARGVCVSAGMEAIHVEGATGSADTNLRAKAEAALKALEDFDFVYVHVKGTDNLSHDGDLNGKVKMIERIDRQLVSRIIDETGLRDLYIALTADHTTPVSVRRHTGDPVPVAVAGPCVRRDRVKRFSERECALGGMGRIRGRHLTPILMNYLGRVSLIGA